MSVLTALAHAQRRGMLRALAVAMGVLVLGISAPSRADVGTWFTETRGLSSGGNVRLVYTGEVLRPVPAGYEPFRFEGSRLVFDKQYLSPSGQVQVDFTNPGNPAFADGAVVQVGSGTPVTVGEDGNLIGVARLPAGDFTGEGALTVRQGNTVEFSAPLGGEAVVQPPGAGGDLGGGEQDPAAGSDRPSTIDALGGRPGRLRADGEGLVPCQDEPCTLEDLKVVVANVFNFLIKVGGAAAVLAVVIAGIRYTTAVFSGDSGAIQAAKQGLMYAIVGTVLLLLAAVIVGTIYLGIFKGQVPVPGLPGGYQTGN